MNKIFMQSIVIKKVGLLVCASLLFLAGCSKKKKTLSSGPWKQEKKVRARIHAPKFPNRKFNITDYGAVGDGKTMNTKAFKKAIAACNKKGGGEVVVPKGVFLTGAIHLKNNVNLHLNKGAKILFSQNPKDYLPMVFTRYQGIELMNYSPFIYARNKKNIAVTGQGVLDGNADKKHWWPWTGAKEDGWKKGEPNDDAGWARLEKMNRKQVPPKKRMFGPGYYLRPNFIQTVDCKNVLISGITIHHSPMWEIHPVTSQNVIIKGVHIKSLGPNNDGIDPESSKDVLIKNCFFNTGDDCIAIKSGRNQDGRRIGKPAEDIIVEDSHMKNGHGGIVMGSEVSGGVKNVYAQNLTMNSPNLDRVLRIKTSSKRGGVIQNVYLRNIQVGTYKQAAILVNMFYTKPGNHMPTVRNIQVDSLNVKNGGKYGILVRAYKKSPVKNLKVTNTTIENVKVPMKIDHARNIQFKNVSINGKSYNKRIKIRNKNFKNQ